MTKTQNLTKTERVASLLASHFWGANKLAEQVVATYEDNLPRLAGAYYRHDTAEKACEPVAEAWDPNVYETEDEADDALAELCDAISLVLVFDR